MKTINYIVASLSRNFSELSDKIENFICSHTINFTSDGIFGSIDAYKEFLSHLSKEQLFSLIHVLFFTALIIAVFNLAAVFYGDSLINLLDIEKRFPSLAKIIKLRIKFQQYYFGLNLIIIFSVLFVLLYFNFFVLIGVI
uniref:Uncharacterized protein n=1 Tax=Pleurotus eryngii TaxID=5323 RepID=A0A343AWR2_PLEER|nr:hypothetical protein [Pleurotus eryngii]APT42224.1 hypothetical protein [Pleurotus eryngii]